MHAAASTASFDQRASAASPSGGAHKKFSAVSRPTSVGIAPLNELDANCLYPRNGRSGEAGSASELQLSGGGGRSEIGRESRDTPRHVQAIQCEEITKLRRYGAGKLVSDKIPTAGRGAGGRRNANQSALERARPCGQGQGLTGGAWHAQCGKVNERSEHNRELSTD